MDKDFEESGRWRLKQGDILLATLEEHAQDFPWVYCRFSVQPEFEPYRIYFSRSDQTWKGREKELHQRIAEAKIRLETEGGNRVHVFTLALTEEGVRLTFTEV